jgi:hypothetical protein
MAWSLSDDYAYKLKLRLPKDFQSGLLVGEGKSAGLGKSIEQNDRDLTLVGKPTPRSIVMNTEIRPISQNQPSADFSITILDFWVHTKFAGTANWSSECEIKKPLAIWNNAQILQYPTWSKEDDSIKFSVTAPHFSNDGATYSGIFSTEIPLDFASCLWKVDLRSKISASVEATYEGNQSAEIVATSARNDGSTYYLSASGFHFSAPTINIKLQQSSSSNSSVPVGTRIQSDASKLNSSTTKKQITIICSKGKLSRNVLGYSPKCPAGFKQKK